MIKIEYLDNNPLIDDVEEFYNLLCTYDYGFMCQNTRMVYSPQTETAYYNAVDKYWRLPDSETVDKNKVGMCYELTRREADWFENECKYPVKTQAYFIEFNSGNTHTWLMFNDSVFDEDIPTYVFEVSWYDHRGVYQVDRDNLLSQYVKDVPPFSGIGEKYVLFEYEPLADNIGITIDEFKWNRWKNGWLRWTNCTSYKDLIESFGLKGMEKELNLERFKTKWG